MEPPESDVIVCEWCERRFYYFGAGDIDAARATIHAYFAHRESLREEYG